MRLLQQISPDEFTINIASSSSSYAILSHTWTDGQEISLQDLIRSTNRHKSGFDKIRFCGEQAVKDGLEYFWVDTCCIDKTNNTELTEAINSMFRWYRDAAKCYVYLPDVSIPDSTEDLEASRSSWEPQLRKSRWFTRGWTLQELIAPKTVEFFSVERVRIGDKGSLEQMICDITGIPVQALRGDPISNFTVTERMKWAANRQTTKEEDGAYCLLGICEVFMPLIYGEGTYAFERLRGEVSRRNKHTQEYEQQEKDDAPFIVPFERNDRFTGRSSELAKLEKKLFLGQRTYKLAISGLGGIGKTQLALELAFRTREKYTNCSVFWIPASDMDSIHQAYLNIAEELGIGDISGTKTDVKKVVQTHLSSKLAKRWLLVFDNADDLDMWIKGPQTDQQKSKMIDYLPKNPQGCIIFTTRDRRVAVKLASSNVIEIQSLQEDAGALLEAYLIDNDVQNSHANVKALLEQLEYLPLAIVQAAAYINENAISIDDYLALLVQQESEVIDLLSEDFEDEFRYENITNPVASTWLVSFEQMRQRDQLATEYLSLMACLDWKDIPKTLLPSGPSKKHELDAIGTLDGYSFITKRPGGSSFDLHRLVHLATRNWLRREDSIKQWTQTAIIKLVQVFPEPTHKTRVEWRVLLPHASYVLKSDFMESENEVGTQLTWQCALCLHHDGRFDEAAVFFEEVTATRKRLLGDEHPDTLLCMGNLVSTYRHQGLWDQAEILGNSVLETRKKVLGENHPDTIGSATSLGIIYSHQGRFKEAEEIEQMVLDKGQAAISLFVESLKDLKIGIDLAKQLKFDEAEVVRLRIAEASQRLKAGGLSNTLQAANNIATTYMGRGFPKKALYVLDILSDVYRLFLGLGDPLTLTVMTNRVWVLTALARYKEAEEMGRLVVDACEKSVGNKHPDTLQAMKTLASLYTKQGKYAEAEKIQLQVIAGQRTSLGIEHHNTVDSMSKLSQTLIYQQKFDEAERLAQTALTVQRRLLVKDHANTLATMGRLSTIYWRLGQLSKAESLSTHIVEARTMALGAEHPSTLTAMNNLALILKDQEKWNEATVLYRKVLEMSQKRNGDEHPSTINTSINLACHLRDSGALKDAEDLEVDALEKSKKVLGDRHPFTLSIMGNLSTTYWRSNRFKEAEDLNYQLLEIRKAVLGPEHHDTLRCMSNIAFACWERNKWNEAEVLQAEILNTMKKVLGPKYPSTIETMGNLAWSIVKQGRWKEAEQLQLDAIEVGQQAFGKDHRINLEHMLDLAKTYQNQGRYEEARALQERVTETRMKSAGEEHPNTLRGMSNMATSLLKLGKVDEAETLILKVVEMQTRVMSDKHIDTLISMGNLVLIRLCQKRYEEGSKLAIQVLESCKSLYGEDHRDTILAKSNLTAVLIGDGEWSKAEILNTEVIELYSTVLGEKHPYTLSAQADRVSIYVGQERRAKAETLGNQLVDDRIEIIGADHPDTLDSVAMLASIRESRASDIPFRGKEG